MCKSRVLIAFPEGYIKRCEECNSFTLKFNNLSLCLSALAFFQFKNCIQACYDEHTQIQTFPNQRCIHFTTRMEGLDFVFSLEELGGLLYNLQAAQLSLIYDEA